MSEGPDNWLKKYYDRKLAEQRATIQAWTRDFEALPQKKQMVIRGRLGAQLALLEYLQTAQRDWQTVAASLTNVKIGYTRALIGPPSFVHADDQIRDKEIIALLSAARTGSFPETDDASNRLLRLLLDALTKAARSSVRKWSLNPVTDQVVDLLFRTPTLSGSDICLLIQLSDHSLPVRSLNEIAFISALPDTFNYRDWPILSYPLNSQAFGFPHPHRNTFPTGGHGLREVADNLAAIGANPDLVEWLKHVQGPFPEVTPLGSAVEPDGPGDLIDAVREIEQDLSVLEQSKQGLNLSVDENGKLRLADAPAPPPDQQEHIALLAMDLKAAADELNSNLISNAEISILRAWLLRLIDSIPDDPELLIHERTQITIWSRGLTLRQLWRHHSSPSNSGFDDEPSLSRTTLAELASLVGQFNRLNHFTKRGAEYDQAASNDGPVVDIATSELKALNDTLGRQAEQISPEIVSAIDELLVVSTQGGPEAEKAKGSIIRTFENAGKAIARHIIWIGAFSSGSAAIYQGYIHLIRFIGTNLAAMSDEMAVIYSLLKSIGHILT